MVFLGWLVVIFNGNYSPFMDWGPKTNEAFLTPGLKAGAGCWRRLPVMPRVIPPAASFERCPDPPMLLT